MTRACVGVVRRGVRRAFVAGVRLAGATVTRVNGSHVSMLSQPKAVADAVISDSSTMSR
ncbi:hypothetical protein [Burkholderia sp. BCC0405]|uniref:hypothetical protein n=1 Tax=Burkholderia sp. BCC0405 TaxID=2676298 RepID=UPI00158BF927|nr:hypothetical protein [Burkholderia sp. BCC0405]